MNTDQRNRKVAILGAGPLQVELIKKASDLGLETLVFASGNNNPGSAYASYFFPISITDREAILEICQQNHIDGICSIASDLAVDTWYYIAERLGLTSNSYASVTGLRNKAKMYEILGKELNVPESSLFKNSETYPFPCIIKPVDAWGSKGVAYCKDLSDLLKYAEPALQASIKGEALISEFIDGMEYSVESVSFKGEHYVLGITSKSTTGPPHFVEIGHTLPSGLDIETIERVTHITKRGLTLLEHQFGASHTEIKIQNGKIFILEVAGRMGGDYIGSRLIPLHTGYDYLKAVLDIALGTFEEPEIQPSGFTGILYNDPDRSVLQEYISGKKRIPSEVIDYNFDARSNTEILHESGDRSSFLIYHSETPFSLDV